MYAQAELPPIEVEESRALVQAILPNQEGSLDVRGRSVIIGLGVCGVGEAFFEDGHPADNHDSRATDQSCEEQDLDQPDRQNHE